MQDYWFCKMVVSIASAFLLKLLFVYIHDLSDLPNLFRFLSLLSFLSSFLPLPFYSPKSAVSFWLTHFNYPFILA